MSSNKSADFVKLGVYVGFFAVLMMFYGLPIHIMRDLFLTTRSFLKRLNALVKYRKALADMNKYPDATQEELAREDTCIICREEMRPWDASTPGAVERSRPKKLPCGHILHFGCLKGWLERQQVCPTCRRSVVMDGNAPNADGAARANADGQPPAPGQPGAANGEANGNQGQQGRQGGMRMFQLGPLRLGFAQGNPQRVQELIQQRFNIGPNGAQVPPNLPQPGVVQQPQQAVPTTHNPLPDISTQLQDIQQRLQQELLTLQVTQAELQTTHALMAELQRLRLFQGQSLNMPIPAQHIAAINGQLPPLQQIIGQAMPQIPMMPPTVAPFAPLNQRLQTPSVTRHVMASNSTALPADSPDLPEGVTIPQGWTLMPLQRVDGSSQQIPELNNTQPVEQPQDQALNEAVRAGLMRAAQAHAQPEAPPENTTTSLPQTRTASPSVAAPTPILPNWGGAAQLFANNGAGTTSAPAAENEAAQRAEESDSDEDEDGEEEEDEDEDDDEEEDEDEGDDEDEEEEQSTSDKGKARAVTIEDTEDSEDE